MDDALPIERAVPADAPEILELQRLAYRSEAELVGDYSIEPLRQTLSDIEAEFATKTVLKIARGGQIIASVRVELQDATCFIGKLIVHPELQKQGLGSVLLQAAESVFPTARRFELFTGHKSTQNLEFYARRGYREFRRKTISDRLILVFMEKNQGRT